MKTPQPPSSVFFAPSFQIFLCADKIPLVVLCWTLSSFHHSSLSVQPTFTSSHSEWQSCGSQCQKLYRNWGRQYLLPHLPQQSLPGVMTCPLYAWKLFPGLAAPSHAKEWRWGCNWPLVPGILLLALSGDKMTPVFLQPSDTSNDYVIQRLSRMTSWWCQFPQFWLVHPTRAHGLTYIQFD